MPVTLSNIASTISASVLGPPADRARSTPSVRSSSGQAEAVATDAVRKPSEPSLGKATRQAAQETESAKVQLSNLGRVRSAFAEARDAARAVQAPVDSSAVPRSSIELRAAATRLVEGVNGASRVSAEVSRPERKSDLNSALTNAALGRGGVRSAAVPSNIDQRSNSSTRVAAVTPEQERVQQAAISLDRSVNVTRPAAANEAQALANIGITAARDGQLSLDRTRFDAALNADRSGVEQTLGRLGQRVETATTGQLAEDGNIGKATVSATVRVDRAETRQGQLDEAQRVVQQRTETLQNVNQTNNPFLVGGVTAYRGVFAL